MSPPSQIIRSGMDDESAAENTLGADQFDEVIGDGALGIALAVGFEVAKISDVADGVRRGAVLL